MVFWVLLRVNLFLFFTYVVYWRYSACVCYMVGAFFFMLPILLLSRVNPETVQKRDWNNNATVLLYMYVLCIGIVKCRIAFTHYSIHPWTWSRWDVAAWGLLWYPWDRSLCQRYAEKNFSLWTCDGFIIGGQFSVWGWSGLDSLWQTCHVMKLNLKLATQFCDPLNNVAPISWDF